MEEKVSFNLKVIETKSAIMKSIVSSGLPATVAQMIINEVKSIIDNETELILKRESEEIIVAEEKKSKEESIGQI